MLVKWARDSVGLYSMRLGDIARELPAELIGDASLDIRRVVHPVDASRPDDLAVALSKEAATALNGAHRAGAVLIAAKAAAPGEARNVLVYSGHERVALAV